MTMIPITCRKLIGAVVALRALNCRARLPEEPGARQFTAPHRPYRF